MNIKNLITELEEVKIISESRSRLMFDLYESKVSTLIEALRMYNVCNENNSDNIMERCITGKQSQNEV